MRKQITVDVSGDTALAGIPNWHLNKKKHIYRGREYKRRRKSQDASCSHAQDTSDGAISSNLQNTVGYTHVQLQGHTSRQHEDLIYLPKDSFPAIQGNLSTN